ncbi:FAD-dependent oxidoreductase [Aeromicrobium sp. A1-2]|uniref:FAD-dependent oxidoreductase n=1 Tax=Aeromicrobium sp. A1-2 TaxID=2107713 RepID=UPI000E482BCF|nr:FAD-dependent oxidoreductase [Aeromicrobium sp. A1-2]AXT86535.1 FAD-dependent oxidoreductase [Aeromicrobium sp. A1-2]
MSLPSVLVVGAGAMGSSAAHELARRGHAVTVLEQHDLLHARGSSHGSSRIVRLVYDDRFYVRLAMRARPLWDRLQDGTDLEVFRRTGSVDHGPRWLLEPFVAALEAEDVAHELLTPSDAARRWPGLRFDDTVLFQPDGGVAHPDNTLSILQRGAAEHGAELRPRTRVTAVEETAGGMRVVTGDGVLNADHVVLAAGVWSHRLADLPDDVATQVQPAHFAAVDPRATWPTFIHRRVGADGRAVPEAYGLPSPHGIKVGFHGGGVVVDPDRHDVPVVAAEIDDLRAYVTDWVPGVVPSSLAAGTCLYGGLAEDDFVIDRIGRLTVATGFSGHGFKFVPLVGAMIADLVAGTTTPEHRFTVSAHRDNL